MNLSQLLPVMSIGLALTLTGCRGVNPDSTSTPAPNSKTHSEKPSDEHGENEPSKPVRYSPEDIQAAVESAKAHLLKNYPSDAGKLADIKAWISGNDIRVVLNERFYSCHFHGKSMYCHGSRSRGSNEPDWNAGDDHGDHHDHDDHQ